MHPTRIVFLLTYFLAGCLLAWGCAPEPGGEASSQPEVARPDQPSTRAETPSPPPPAHSPEDAARRLDHGIDLSVHSGDVDWERIAAAGYGFAILKATEGVDLEDGAFAAHWQRAAEVGLIRGAYHFYVTEDDPNQQADWFTSKVALQPGDIAPIVDIELIGHGTPAGWQENVLTFVRRLHEHYGVAPIVYTGPKFWQTHFQGETAREMSEYPLWIAEYGVDEPVVPDHWPTWHLWQYRGDAEISGIEKGADISRVHREAVDPATLLVPRKSSAAAVSPEPH
ncbi:MAG: hypothetical protein MPN21_15675 [Thermoanaerobaculia bacterium]|nr:hypothetical protein [Thermoanaerobaculia bacterium]